MEPIISFTLSYDGCEAEFHEIDLYDVSQALVGFQRSLALTTHLVLNGEIITQSPALKGARILAGPAQDGSWKIVATILAGMYAAGTAPKDTPLGHIVHSVYDYVISESLGVHVDYEKSIGQLVEEHRTLGGGKVHVEQHKVDSLIEKCSTAILNIHRPIVETKTAAQATILASLYRQQKPTGPAFSVETYDYLREEFADDRAVVVKGRVTSYNSNTFKGRIYVSTEGRPVAFELAEHCRSNRVVELVTASLAANAVKEYNSPASSIWCRVVRSTSRSGHLKKYRLLEVSGTKIS